MDVRYVDEVNKITSGFELSGDQWMIEGYILRWKPFLRFLGAKPYYKVTRFSGAGNRPTRRPSPTTSCGPSRANGNG